MRQKQWFILLFVLFILILAAGCKTREKEKATAEDTGDTREPILLKAITMGNEPAGGMDAIYEQLDKLTVQELGCRVRFTFIPWGNEEEQIKRLTMTKDYDIYCGGSFSGLSELIGKHAYLDISGLLKEVPDLVKHYTIGGVNLLENLAVDGDICQIPALSDTYSSQGFFYREDLREEWGIDPVTSFTQIEEYLYKSAAEYPDTAPINDKRVGDILWKDIQNALLWNSDYLYVAKDDPYTVKIRYEASGYTGILETLKKWYEDGIIAGDILSLNENNTMSTLELLKAGKTSLEFNNHFRAICDNYIVALKDMDADSQWGWYDYAINSASVYQISVNTGSQSLMIGLGCKYPELALKFIEKVHTDQRYYDLLMYGVDGINYNLCVDGHINYDGIPAENKIRGWSCSDDYLLERDTEYMGEWTQLYDNVTTEYKKLAEENGYNILDNFIPDISGMSHITDELDSIYDSYIQPLTVGITDNPEKDLNKALNLMYKAGLQTLLDTVQQQLDEFYRDNTP